MQCATWRAAGSTCLRTTLRRWVVAGAPETGGWHGAGRARPIWPAAARRLLPPLATALLARTQPPTLPLLPSPGPACPRQVERLQKRVRDPRAGYFQSLDVLRAAKECGVYTKSSLMLGLGEGMWNGWVPALAAAAAAAPAASARQLLPACATAQHTQPPPLHSPPPTPVHPAPAIAPGESDDEIIDAMVDLKEAGVDILTFGQYLQASRLGAKLD